jgi:hypothetical protein
MHETLAAAVLLEARAQAPQASAPVTRTTALGSWSQISDRIKISQVSLGWGNKTEASLRLLHIPVFVSDSLSLLGPPLNCVRLVMTSIALARQTE